AQFGFGMLWTMPLTYPLMTAVQMLCAQVGRVTGAGLAENMGQVLPRWMVTSLVSLLFVANTINIGADLAAMGEAASLVAGGHPRLFTVGFVILSLGLQLFVPYHRYVRVLKWLTMTLLAYVAVVFSVKLDWGEVAWSFIRPQIEFSKEAVVMVVAVFGTTISPYLFFWQSAQEVEDVDIDPVAEPLIDAPRQARGELKRIRIDTFVGMGVSNLIALAIMISTAATLHVSSQSDINTAADAARALEPAAGSLAFAMFSLGIIGTGLLAVPVLAGSAAYAIGESRGWKCGLENKPWEAVGFYTIITLSTLLGLGIVVSPLDPMKALFWSAVINGVAAVPIMVGLMLVAQSRDRMGAFRAGRLLRGFGWLATAVMAAASLAMLIVQ
ncbi:MAG TPA: divalent metal cation transporter, partial [Phenylobacterium sp.]|nr:divalent metal cation transporter [Phenylobacterium sp.]